MSRFDKHCPHCEAELDCLPEAHTERDYALDFTMACPECGTPINVKVHVVPEFELSK